MGGYYGHAYNGLLSVLTFTSVRRCYSLAQLSLLPGPASATFRWISLSYLAQPIITLSSLHKSINAAVPQRQAHKSPAESAPTGSLTLWWVLRSSLTWPTTSSDTHGQYCSLAHSGMLPAPAFVSTSGQQVMLLSPAQVSHVGGCFGLAQTCPPVSLPSKWWL